MFSNCEEHSRPKEHDLSSIHARARTEIFFSKKNATLPLALCLWGLRRWHYGGISGIFGRIIQHKDTELQSFLLYAVVLRAFVSLCFDG